MRKPGQGEDSHFSTLFTNFHIIFIYQPLVLWQLFLILHYYLLMILLYFPFTIMCFQNFRPQEFLLAKRDSVSFSLSFSSKFFSLLGTPPLQPYANCAPPLTSVLRSPTTPHARRGHSPRRIQCGSPLVGGRHDMDLSHIKGVVA